MWSTWELKLLFICFQYTTESLLKGCLIVKHGNSEELKLNFLHLAFRTVYLSEWIAVWDPDSTLSCNNGTVGFFLNYSKSEMKAFVLNSKTGQFVAAPQTFCEWGDDSICERVSTGTSWCRPALTEHLCDHAKIILCPS